MIIPFVGGAIKDETYAEKKPALLARSLLGHSCVEVVEGQSASGTQMCFECCLLQAPETRSYMALVDAQNLWAPDEVNVAVLPHVLWVRCHDRRSALKAADIIVRDENFRIILIDLRELPDHYLRNIPQSQWYRLQRIAQSKNTTLIVAVSRPVVCSAELRVEIDLPLDIKSFQKTRADCRSEMKWNFIRQRVQQFSDKPWLPVTLKKSRAS